jgi:hypothetical protein
MHSSFKRGRDRRLEMRANLLLMGAVVVAVVVPPENARVVNLQTLNAFWPNARPARHLNPHPLPFETAL